MMSASEATIMTHNVEEMKTIHKAIETACTNGDYAIYIADISCATRNKLVALGYNVQYWACTGAYRIKWGELI